MKRAARSLRSSILSTLQNNTQRRARLIAAAAVSSAALAALSQSAMAQNLYWDKNGTTAGTSATSTGSWDLTTPFWGDTAGTLAPGVWASGNVAVFSAGTTGTGLQTITVPAGITVPGVTGIQVEEG